MARRRAYGKRHRRTADYTLDDLKKRQKRRKSGEFVMDEYKEMREMQMTPEEYAKWKLKREGEMLCIERGVQPLGSHKLPKVKSIEVFDERKKRWVPANIWDWRRWHMSVRWRLRTETGEKHEKNRRQT